MSQSQIEDSLKGSNDDLFNLAVSIALHLKTEIPQYIIDIVNSKQSEFTFGLNSTGGFIVKAKHLDFGFYEKSKLAVICDDYFPLV